MRGLFFTVGWVSEAMPNACLAAHSTLGIASLTPTYGARNRIASYW